MNPSSPSTRTKAGSAQANARRIGVFATLIAIPVLVLALDQGAKALVVNLLPLDSPVHVWDDILIFQYVRNPGAAFSFASGATWIFSVLAVVVVGVIVWVARRLRSFGWAVMLGLLLGGTLGNLTDRLFREPGFGVGWVVDFINLPWLMPAIFNVADIAITGSVVVLVILVLTGRNLDGSRGSRSAESGKKSATSRP